MGRFSQARSSAGGALDFCRPGLAADECDSLCRACSLATLRLNRLLVKDTQRQDAASRCMFRAVEPDAGLDQFSKDKAVTNIKIFATHVSGRILTMICLGLPFPMVVSAEPIAATLDKWGLIGTASKDCTKPASAANAHNSYIVRADASVYYAPNYGRGNDSLNSFELEAATIEPSGPIVLRVTRSEKTRGPAQVMGPAGRFTEDSTKPREWTLSKGSDGRFRVMSNREVGGDYSVRDGKLVINGVETPWYTTCN